MLAHERFTAEGLAPTFEQRIPGYGWAAVSPLPPVTVAELVRRGLAREHPGPLGLDGRRASSRYEIAPAGRDEIRRQQDAIRR